MSYGGTKKKILQKAHDEWGRCGDEVDHIKTTLINNCYRICLIETTKHKTKNDLPNIPNSTNNDPSLTLVFYFHNLTML